MTIEKDKELSNSSSERADINNMEFQLKVAETLNDLTKIRILLLLWASGELSINELCEKLGKTRPTVLKHLKELKKTGLLKVQRKEKKMKMYSVIPNLLELTRLDLEHLKSLPSAQVKRILEKDLDSDKKTIQLIKKILDDCIPYYQDLKKYLKEAHKLTPDEIETFYKRKHINYYVEVLDEEEYQEYFKFYEELMEKMDDFREKRKMQGKPNNNKKPFASFHIILPIKEIQEARFNRMWKKE